MSGWTLGASAEVIVLALIAWVAAAGLGWTHYRRSGGKGLVGWLEGFRFLIVSLLVATFLKPEKVTQIRREEAPEVAVLLDQTGSMQTRDVTEGGKLMRRSEWLGQIQTSNYWETIRPGARVVLEPFGTGGTASSSATLSASATSATSATNATNATNATAEGTDLDAVLRSTLNRHGNLKAVLLLTDGTWNTGPSPVGVAMRYRDEGVPIFALGVGRESPVPDLVLADAQAPSYGLFGEQIAIPFKVVNHLAREVRSAVILEDGKKELARREVTVPAHGELQEAIVWFPRAAGETPLRLRIPVEPDEGLPENNARDFSIQIRVETLKVLVVDSLPRWEYRFLRNALERDPGVEMNSILFHPHIGMGGGRKYLAKFPSTKEQISRYDVIFLGDVGLGEGELTEGDAELMKGLVEQQSSGLVFIPGRRGRQLTLSGTALKDLYPVVMEPGKPDGVILQNEAALQLSTAGRRHWLTRFDSDEKKNEEIWKQLAGFFWSAAVEKSRPGSDVLAVHSALRNNWGRVPMLVTRNAGSGKVLFLGMDSAWRWRLGVEDRYHYRFWSQVVRWMAHPRHLASKQGIRLTYSPEVPRAGDTVHVQVMVMDAAGFPAGEGPVQGRIVSPSGRTERLDFAGVSGGWGVFEGMFVARQGGRHKMEVKAEKQGRQLETEIQVEAPLIEKAGEPVNGAALRELASLSKGLFASYDRLADVVKQLSVLPDPKPMERRLRLWSDPRWGGFLLILLGLYWTGRKVAGMI